MPLYRPSELLQLDISPKRTLSQNFLIDRNVLDKIVKVAEIKKGDLVVEIGPGPGALTEALLAQGAEVVALEKDQVLSQKLKEWKDPHLEVIEIDALEFSLEEWIQEKKKTKTISQIKVVANLPYHITAALLKAFLPLSLYIKTLTVLVQREVGEKMIAKPGSKKSAPGRYGLLSLWVSSYATALYCFTIKPTSFFPSPSVHSCVMHLSLHSFPFSFDSEGFFEMLSIAFSHRRKMLKVSLKERWEGALIEKALVSAKLSLQVRPEQLSLEDFGKIYTLLCSGRSKEKTK